MEFRFRRYRTAGAACPVDDVLNELLETHQLQTHALVIAGLERLRRSELHGEPLTKALMPEWDFLEMRAAGTRIFWIYRPGRLIVLLGGVNGKDQRKLPRRVFQVIDGYRLDYLKRCTGDEDNYDEQF